ncbi:MAG TPA: transferrin receptor-like dimerization domain-containing protein, partial [Terriglobales bacterium]|nr:transferrin receptor-like dimerization domain-containing protein [Terriglobales bacterium]
IRPAIYSDSEARLMRRLTLAVLLLFIPVFTARAADEHTYFGYLPQSAQTEQQWETKFRAIPDPALQREYMQHLSARPHHVGSPYDKENAEWILNKFKSWGLDAHIETFNVLFPTPKERLVEMVAPTQFRAKLEEPTIPVDPTSGQKAEQLPTYNAYSIDGDVTAPLVFVNYGVVEDYKRLQRLGVSVKGAIVIAKYGHSWRGVKPKLAYLHGAIGCLIYSDPKDDGYYQEPTFPDGPMRPLEGVQRGSVMDFMQYPGDPLTPGVGATPDAKRLAVKDAPTITKIPVMPISYGDAEPLLKALSGPMAPADWRGALALPYHVGPGPTKVHFKINFNWDIKPVYDVVFKIPGAIEPDTWIVRGNHHDAWVNGAEDPISGQVALLEEARSLSELMKQGWKPRRTIIYCAWDGEEPMLLGSTEWAEYHGPELKQHAAIYINSDGNGRGYFGAGGSHTLESFVNEVTKDIQDPEKHISVWKRDQDRELSMGTPEEKKEARSRPDLRIEPLGSGTDFTTFLDHLGIASLNLEYGGEDKEGIYHSIYDDFYWFTHFSDTDFTYGRALSQTIGSMVMRFADADVLPYQFTDFADTMKMYDDQLKKMLKDQQDEATETNRDLDDGVYAATSDPKHPTVAPAREEVPPYLNFAPLDNAIATLTQSAARYRKASAHIGSDEANTNFAALNELLLQSSRRLTLDEGLPRRPWYKNMIYAPGWFTGYAPKTMPGIREAIEEKRYNDADPEIEKVAKVLQAETELIDQASAELEKNGK